MPWHAKSSGGYTTSTPVYYYPDADGQDNCLMIWSMLRTRGWTPNAAAGLLTCIALESGYNPWAWQGAVPSSTQYNNLPRSGRAYGLVQWDPASYNNAAYIAAEHQHPNKYIDNPNSVNLGSYGPNFSDVPGKIDDGAAQIAFLDSFGWIGQYSPSVTYPEYGQLAPSYQSYKSSTLDPGVLADVWVVNFERPGNPFRNQSYRRALAPELYQLISGAPAQSSIPAWLLLKWRQSQIGGKGYI